LCTYVTNPTDDELQRVFTMKRQLIALRQIVTPQRDMFAALVAGRYDIPGLDEESTRYVRDVYDHLIRVSMSSAPLATCSPARSTSICRRVGAEYSVSPRELIRGWSKRSSPSNQLSSPARFGNRARA
jgi:CorA-like Mg2+ transporter protein